MCYILGLMRNRKQTSKSELERLIRERFPVGKKFSTDDLRKFDAHFRRLYPTNTKIRDSMARTLQELRKAGIVEFIDYRGYYRLRKQRSRSAT